MPLSIIIPTLNEADAIVPLLETLQPLRAAGHAEILLADGGSQDTTITHSHPLVDKVVASAPGRARQMNRAARQARYSMLWFLHADTQLDMDTLVPLLELPVDDPCWGRFDIRLSGDQRVFRVIEWFINHRSRLTGVATGDQGIFVHRDWFERIGRYPDIPLMEDVALSKALRQIAPPCCLRERLQTSSRRWEQNGIARTVLLMWWLRFAYFIGISPERLIRHYRPAYGNSAHE